MYPRTKYQMSPEDLNGILEACKPTPVMLIGGYTPAGPQENANRAWSELGKRMGFDHMTVQPDGSDMKCFTAIPNEPEEARQARLTAEAEARRLERIEELKEQIAQREHELGELTRK